MFWASPLMHVGWLWVLLTIVRDQFPRVTEREQGLSQGQVKQQLWGLQPSGTVPAIPKTFTFIKRFCFSSCQPFSVVDSQGSDETLRFKRAQLSSSWMCVSCLGHTSQLLGLALNVRINDLSSPRGEPLWEVLWPCHLSLPLALPVVHSKPQQTFNGEARKLGAGPGGNGCERDWSSGVFKWYHCCLSVNHLPRLTASRAGSLTEYLPVPRSYSVVLKEPW